MSSSNLPSVIAFPRSAFTIIFIIVVGIFLAHFLIKIDFNIISSLPVVFSLCTRVGWCDVCNNNVIKIDVDVEVNEMSLLNIQQAQHSRNI